MACDYHFSGLQHFRETAARSRAPISSTPALSSFSRPSSSSWISEARSQSSTAVANSFFNSSLLSARAVAAALAVASPSFPMFPVFYRNIFVFPLFSSVPGRGSVSTVEIGGKRPSTATYMKCSHSRESMEAAWPCTYIPSIDFFSSNKKNAGFPFF